MLVNKLGRKSRREAEMNVEVGRIKTALRGHPGLFALIIVKLLKH